MKEFKGTKGDWEVDINLGGVFSTDKKETGNIICLAPYEFNDSLKNWKANAQLIATAPELLKALQLCYKVLVEFNTDDSIDAHFVAYKTINKALGNENN